MTELSSPSAAPARPWPAPPGRRAADRLRARVCRRSPGRQAGSGSWYRYKIGDMEVTVVSDGSRPGPLADTFLQNAKKDDVNKALRSRVHGKGQADHPVRDPVVVNTGGKLIAIDTGLGAGRLRAE